MSNTCAVCGQSAHSFMRVERVIAAAFNGFAAMMTVILFIPRETA